MKRFTIVLRAGLTLMASLTLGACGGGGSDGSSNGGSQYVSWTDSANGTVIMDAVNHQFAVDSSSGAVVSLATNSILTGLSVQTSTGNVIYNGTVIGVVILDFSTSGSKITSFACSGPAPNAMTITVTPPNWNHSCASSATPPPTTPPPTTPPPTTPPPTTPPTSHDGVNVSSCLTLENQGVSLYMRNNCNVRAEFTYCFTNRPNDILFKCDVPDHVGNYGKGGSSVPAGGLSTMPASAGAAAILFACAAGPSGIMPIPILTSLNPPLGRCD